MAKVRLTADGKYAEFHCPACDEIHMVSIKPAQAAGWTFNGDLQAPTFTPSVDVTCGHYVTRRPQPQPPNCEFCNEAAKEGFESCCVRCHSVITAGNIAYCGDSSHALAGKTVPLPDKF